MMRPVKITLVGEPVGKGRPRFVRATGRVYTPSETRKYEDRLRDAARKAMVGRQILEGPIAVRVHADMPVPASWSRKKREEALRGSIRPTVSPDADNFLKTMDALNEVVWLDDKQIVEAWITKRYSEHPALTIEAAPAMLFTFADLFEQRSAA